MRNNSVSKCVRVQVEIPRVRQALVHVEHQRQFEFGLSFPHEGQTVQVHVARFDSDHNHTRKHVLAEMFHQTVQVVSELCGLTEK